MYRAKGQGLKAKGQDHERNGCHGLHIAFYPVMGRDQRKLRVFHDAHALAIEIYRHTRDLPRDEHFGLRSQMRRAAVSIATNLVEGSARGTARDYLRFLHVAFGSTCELRFLIVLAGELQLLQEADRQALTAACDSVVKQLNRLVDGVAGYASAGP